MNIARILGRLTTSVLIGFAATSFLMAGISNADELPVPMNLPSPITADITPGMESVEIPFGLTGVDGVIVEVIVPVDDPSFTMLDPSGTIVLASGGTEVNFTAGSALAPDEVLPGGVFITQELSEPVDGTWAIRLNFPPAPERTVVVATVFTRTSYQAGIALARETYLTGEDVSIGMLVLKQGQPVAGLAPQIQISLNGYPGSAFTMIGLDGGVDPDGLADDGIYSVDYTFSQPGDYLIKGVVNIVTAEGVVNREAIRTVKVTDPPVKVIGVSSNIVLSPGGCVAAIEETIDLDVTKPGEYIARGTLTVAGGATLEKRARGDFMIGERSLVLSYPGQEIMKTLGDEGPYNFKDLDVLYFDDENFTLASRSKDVGVTQEIGLNSLCRDPIEIGTELTVDTVLADGYINALEFGVPINVQVSGNYQISVKIIGSAGENIELVGFTQYLTEGSNTASFSLSADRFQTADGPYAVISALVLGPGGTAQLAQVGESPAFQRWQFYPVRAGDLDNDGDVDGDDRNLILAARNKPALSPGDRRDIVRDERIDLRDARAILRLR